MAALFESMIGKGREEDLGPPEPVGHSPAPHFIIPVFCTKVESRWPRDAMTLLQSLREGPLHTGRIVGFGVNTRGTGKCDANIKLQ